jgi:pimeloyl-ACP methyl ester carboxylesterase
VPPDAELPRPDGFVVETVAGTRLHFLDWGDGDADGQGTGVLLIPGLLQPASSWAPVARRLAADGCHVVVEDLRGQGLSDAPIDGYDLDTLAADALTVVEGSGLGAGGIVVAGHGFGGAVAAVVASLAGRACRGVVLVDGGFERSEAVTDVDVDTFLRELDEPPEVMRSMRNWLADRRGYDPTTWDADQEQAARDAVVETAAGHVVRAVRPPVVEALVRSMFDYDPAPVLAAVEVPVRVLVAGTSGDRDARLAEARRVDAARAAGGLQPMALTILEGAAHNLMRYRPDAVAGAIHEMAG